MAPIETRTYTMVAKATALYMDFEMLALARAPFH